MWPKTAIDPLITIFPYSTESIGPAAVTFAGGFINSIASNTYPSANTAIFVPFSISTKMIPLNMFVLNGAAVSGNIDVGIYSIDGTRLWSAGSTAQAGISAIQTFAVSGLQLGSGVYYMAIVMDNATGTIYRQGIASNTNYPKTLGMATMAAAFPLPATATLATCSISQLMMYGLTNRSVV